MSRPLRGSVRSARTGADERGFALLGVFVLSLGILLFGMSFMVMTGYESNSAQKMLDSEKAFWLAEAGQSRALFEMEHRLFPYEKRSVILRQEPGPDGGTFTVTVHPDPGNAFSVLKTFVVESVGESRGIERRTLQTVAMTSFAFYAYFTDEETGPTGGRVWFVDDNVIEGPTHTNGTMQIWGSPEFKSRVTSSSDHMVGYPRHQVTDPSGWPTPDRRNNPHFRKGFELGVPRIPLPENTTDLREEAEIGGKLLTSPDPAVTLWDLEFGVRMENGVKIEDARGWLRYRIPEHNGVPEGPWISLRVSDLASKVIYADGELRIQGRLDGEVTLGSRADIRIMDDLVYWDSDARGTPLAGADDLLGLVAGRNIVFDNSPATNDLKVNAVMMALDTSIYLDDYRRGRKGSLTVWGGLIQKHRGVVSRHNDRGRITSGYTKDYHYDARVTARTPPYFPLPGIYTVLDWSEGWQSVSFF